MDSTLRGRVKAALSEGALVELLDELAEEGRNRDEMRRAFARVLVEDTLRPDPRWSKSLILEKVCDEVVWELTILERSRDESSLEAQVALVERYQRHRERTAMAFRQRDSMVKIVRDTAEIVERLRYQIEDAVGQGNANEISALERKKRQYEVTLRTTQESLEQAEETAIAVQMALKREQETLRRKGVPLPDL